MLLLRCAGVRIYSISEISKHFICSTKCPLRSLGWRRNIQFFPSLRSQRYPAFLHSTSKSVSHIRFIFAYTRIHGNRCQTGDFSRCGEVRCVVREQRGDSKDGAGRDWKHDRMGICHSYTPDGRCVSLLKILLTNYCVYDCKFCVNRISSDTPRARFTPEEVVSLTLDFYRRNYIEGLFLSSGIIQSPDYTMEQLVAVARGLRTEHKFNGYIHLKAIPGASREILHEAGTLGGPAERQCRAADAGGLDEAGTREATGDDPADDERDHVGRRAGERRIRAAVKIVSRPGAAPKRVSTKRSRFAPAGQSTQMVVGATDTNDATILNLASDLYGTHGLRRIYYSAFSPFPKADSRLPIQAPPLVREHRLYEADWLMRYYGFSAGELTTATHAAIWICGSTRSWTGRCGIERSFRSISIDARARSCCGFRGSGIGQ